MRNHKYYTTYNWLRLGRLWRWLPHRLSKCQSQPTTILLRTTQTWTINQSQIFTESVQFIKIHFHYPRMQVSQWTPSNFSLTTVDWKLIQSMAVKLQELYETVRPYRSDYTDASFKIYEQNWATRNWARENYTTTQVGSHKMHLSKSINLIEQQEILVSTVYSFILIWQFVVIQTQQQECGVDYMISSVDLRKI